MKTKLIICFSAVLLMVGVACQSSPPPQHPEPVTEPLPVKCPVPQLQQSVPARCCIVLCSSGKYPEASYKRCQDKIFEKYNCDLTQQSVINFMMYGCHCN